MPERHGAPVRTVRVGGKIRRDPVVLLLSRRASRRLLAVAVDGDEVPAGVHAVGGAAVGNVEAVVGPRSDGGSRLDERQRREVREEALGAPRRGRTPGPGRGVGGAAVVLVAHDGLRHLEHAPPGRVVGLVVGGEPPQMYWVSPKRQRRLVLRRRVRVDQQIGDVPHPAGGLAPDERVEVRVVGITGDVAGGGDHGVGGVGASGDGGGDRQDAEAEDEGGGQRHEGGDATCVHVGSPGGSGSDRA